MLELIENIRALSIDKAAAVGICGLPGAGKTTLSRQLASQFQGAEVMSADDFISVSTKQKRKFLARALQEKDWSQLEYLARPTNRVDNPYADPCSWYDWSAMGECLRQIKAGHIAENHNAWNQQSGEVDQVVCYRPLQAGQVCFVDSIYLFEPALTNLLDYKIMIELAPELAAERQTQRDAHRLDQLYQEYKNLVTGLYCKPYLDQYREDIDVIVTRDLLPL